MELLDIIGLVEEVCSEVGFRYRRTGNVFVLEFEGTGLTQTIECDRECMTFRTEYTAVGRDQMAAVRALADTFNYHTLKIGTVTIRDGVLGCRTGIFLYEGAAVDRRSVANHISLGPNILRLFVEKLNGDHTSSDSM